MVRESTFFALFLGCDLHTHTKNWNKRRSMLFIVMLLYSNTKHKQWSVTVSIILFFMGVQARQPKIRISLGGSALYGVQKLAS